VEAPQILTEHLVGLACNKLTSTMVRMKAENLEEGTCQVYLETLVGANSKTLPKGCRETIVGHKARRT